MDFEHSSFCAINPSICRDCLSWFFDGPLDCPKCGSLRIVNHLELADLTIAHIDCDAFYAAVEKRDDPNLRDKPVIIGSNQERGVVTTACYIARQFGPHSAMPMFKARELCPQAVIIPPNMAKYRRISRQIQKIFQDVTPIFQPISLDEAYLDLSDAARDNARDWPALALARIAARVELEIGITVSVGLSYNKFLAKLASEIDKPCSFSVIGRAEAKSFLSTLPVQKVNGIGFATARRMAEEGIDSIGQLQRMSKAELISRFGKFGRQLADYVLGVDNRKVSIGTRAKSISAETTFSRNLHNADALKEQAFLLCNKIADQLKAKDLSARTAILKLKTSDFKIITRNRKLPRPTQKASVIYGQVELLIDKVVDGRAFRLLGIGLSQLDAGIVADPPDLFEDLGT